MLSVLTSLRFFAALLVFLWHTHIFGAYLDKFQLGYAGVGFFYVLSGFILTYVYFFKLKTFNIAAIKKFYIARIAKLYPVQIATLIIAAIPLFILSLGDFFSHTTLNNIGVFVTNLFLLQAWFPDAGVHFSFNGVSWSISVEMFFYILFPFIILAIVRFQKYLTIKRLIVAMILLWIIMTAIYAPQASFVDDWRFYILPAARLPDFVMGVLLGVIYLRTKQNSALQKKIERTNFTKLEWITVGLLLLAIIISPIIPQAMRFGLWLMPFWVLIVIIFAHQKGFVSRILSLKAFVFLGEISFSFYMTHLLIINHVGELHLSHRWSFILSLTIAVLVSSLTYLLYEEPLRLRLRGFLERKFVRRSI